MTSLGGSVGRREEGGGRRDMQQQKNQGTPTHVAPGRCSSDHHLCGDSGDPLRGAAGSCLPYQNPGIQEDP